uniref:Very-long-chain 3-oxoacyl-CoA synthase n=1 Tax=Steinernema glaseri TaxID=37863 RepID=A0A1I7YGQ5_9BILA
MALVQAISQSIFCIFPKQWSVMETFFGHVPAMFRVPFYYHFFFSIHVFLTCGFVVLKLFRDKKHTNVVSVQKSGIKNTH